MSGLSTEQMRTKWWGVIPAFDPEAGNTVLGPEADGPGNWVGAPNIIHDPQSNGWYLYARIRRPRPARGAACTISWSAEGLVFEEVWRCTKEELSSESIERGCLVRTPEGRWRLYLSYVNGETQKWQIDVMEADTPRGFDVRDRVPVLLPESIGAEGVKDPYIVLIGGMYYMYLSVAARLESQQHSEEELHGTGDIFNTGLTRAYTGLATSPDGRRFQWHGPVIEPKQGTWYAYGARIAAVLPAGPLFAAFFDGTADVEQNYEEQTGIAVGTSPRDYEIVSVTEPAMSSPWATGSLRYMDAVPVNDRVWRFYYEYAREDGAHELRMSEVALG